MRLIRMIEGNLRAGITAAVKARDNWPKLPEVQQSIAQKSDLKPAAAAKFLKLFDQFDRVQVRSLTLLEESFEHIRVILDRLQAPEPTQSRAPQAPVKK